jgi:hypothetical protein
VSLWPPDVEADVMVMRFVVTALGDRVSDRDAANLVTKRQTFWRLTSSGWITRYGSTEVTTRGLDLPKQAPLARFLFAAYLLTYRLARHAGFGVAASRRTLLPGATRLRLCAASRPRSKRANQGPRLRGNLAATVLPHSYGRGCPHPGRRIGDRPWRLPSSRQLKSG